MKKIVILFMLNFTLHCNVLAIKAHAWGGDTHRYILAQALEILKTDGKDDIATAYTDQANEGVNASIYAGITDPDEYEKIIGTHYYLVRGKSKDGYYKNRNGNYSRSARTRFEEHYSEAINQYFNGHEDAALLSLGRGLHYIGDMGCPPHAAGVIALDSLTGHTPFEHYVNGNLPDISKTSASDLYTKMQESDIGPLLNKLGKVAASKVHKWDRYFFFWGIEKKSNAKDTVSESAKYTAAILSKFYHDVNDANTQYVEDGASYRIKNRNSNQYLSVKEDKVQMESEGEIFVAKFNSSNLQLGKFIYSGYFKFVLASDEKSALSIKDGTLSIRTSMNTLSQYFKIVCPQNNEVCRIMTASSEFAKVLSMQSAESVETDKFDPGDSLQEWIFEKIN